MEDARSIVARLASTDDLGALVTLASRSFFDAYRETDDHAVIEEYCARNFTRAHFASILVDASARLLVAAEPSGELAGYAHIADTAPPPCVSGPRPVELVRLYLDRKWIGLGVGGMLMRASIGAARALGGRTLWLGVYERNPRAMAFYGRFGMQVVGTKPWVWGGETFQDPVMERAIDCVGP